MKKVVFRILVCVLILSLSLPANSNRVLAEGETPPVPSALEWEAFENLPDRMEHDRFLMQEHVYPPELAGMFPGGVEELEQREYTPPSPEIIALTQQQVQNFVCATVTDVPVTECEALVALYNSTNGAGWTNSANWLITTTVDDWYGVTVSNGHVTAISLGHNNLVGPLPPELGGLPYVSSIFLGFNHLSGPIPIELSALTNLNELHLHFNWFSGLIPAELGNLTNLSVLSLDANNLSGEIPVELGNLFNLQNLGLSLNALYGPIPAEFGNLINLQFLDLYNNELSGDIPQELGDLSYLRVLSLSSNKLSGGIPIWLGEMPNLIAIEFEFNQLIGPIPAELGNLSNLVRLSLAGNRLDGQIPPELGNLFNLLRLDLAKNQLTGEIPTFLGNMPNLYYLGLENNQLSGPIPLALSNLTELTYLYLSDNQLTGAVPAWLGILSYLDEIDLSSNQLSGSIPPEIGNLANLTRLNLFSNLINNLIPPEIGNLVNLVHLDLRDNMLSGEIPASITNLVNLCEPGNTNPPCYGYLKTDLSYNRLNVPATEPGVEEFLAIKDPDWYLTQAVEAEIPGDTGGTVTSNDSNTVIEIPAGAVEGLFTILFAPQPDPSEDIGVLNFAGNSFELTAFNELGPVESFTEPLTLTLQYDETSLGVIPEDTLLLYYWDTDQLAWLDAASTCDGGTYIRNFDENWLRLPVCHLSEFALLGDSFDLFLPSIRR